MMDTTEDGMVGILASLEVSVATLVLTNTANITYCS